MLAPLLSVVPVDAATPYLASGVLGQPNFTTKNSGTTATTFGGYVTAVTLDYTGHRMFVSDADNNRVLVFNLDSNNNLVDKTADFVLGQANFTSSTAATTQSGMNYPEGLYYDTAEQRLFVAEYNNTRVLVFNLSGGITNGMNASNVLGQANFTSNTEATTQNGFDTPADIKYNSVNKNLFVSDYDNCRIMIFDISSGITDGMNASKVLGQPDFTSANCDTTQSGMDGPWGLEFDSATSRLFIADFANDRVLIYNLSGGITNGMNASNVLGQENFTTIDSTIRQDGTNSPLGIGLDPGSGDLFIQEPCRVSVYNTNNVANGENAVGVLGQTDFTSNVCTVSQSNFEIYDYSVTISYDNANQRLWFADTANYRVLSFDFAHIATASNALPEATFGVPYSTNIDTSGTQGTATCSLASGSLPQGITLNSDCTISGTPASNTVYTFTVLLSDNNGIAGTFNDSQQFTLAVNHAANSNSDGLADTGENTKRLAMFAAFLLFAGAFGVVMMLKKTKFHS